MKIYTFCKGFSFLFWREKNINKQWNQILKQVSRTFTVTDTLGIIVFLVAVYNAGILSKQNILFEEQQKQSIELS